MLAWAGTQNIQSCLLSAQLPAICIVTIWPNGEAMHSCQLQIGACLFRLVMQRINQVQDAHAGSSFAEHVDCALWEVGMG